MDQFEIRQVADDQLEAVSGGMMHLVSNAPNPPQNGTTAGAGNSWTQLADGLIVLGLVFGSGLAI